MSKLFMGVLPAICSKKSENYLKKKAQKSMISPPGGTYSDLIELERSLSDRKLRNGKKIDNVWIMYNSAALSALI